MNRNAFAQDLHERCETFVFVLIDLRRLGDKRLDHRWNKLVRVETQFGERLGHLGRMHGAGRQRPDFM
jgi:hypothetical protein